MTDVDHRSASTALFKNLIFIKCFGFSVGTSEDDEMVLYYDRILRHRKIIVNKSDTVWNWAFNMPCKSLKGILVLFEEEKTFARDMSKYYNLKIQKVSVVVEGKPNQLYAQGMRSFEQYDEACNILLKGS